MKVEMYCCPNSEYPLYFSSHEIAANRLDCEYCQVDRCRGPKVKILSVPNTLERAVAGMR